MALTRVVYTDTILTFTSTLLGGGNQNPISLSTVQNATFTVNIPRENVNAMGFGGTIDRPQLTAADATCEFSYIPELAILTPSTSSFSGEDLNELIQDSKKGNPTRNTSIVVNGMGQLDNSLMNSMGFEGAVGALPTMTMGFTGVKAASIPAAGAARTNLATPMVLLEPRDIALNLTSFLPIGGADACAQSVSFSWEMPVEKIVCLGQNPTLAANVNVFGNPPGTCSITVEALNDQIADGQAAATYNLKVGAYQFNVVGMRIDSKTNSLAIGELFGTFNYVLGGTADGVTVANVVTTR